MSPVQSKASYYYSGFLRAIGVRGGFRRTGASSLFNIAIAAGVGVISGHYIFREPLEQYWSEHNDLQEGAASAAAPAQRPPATSAKN